MERRERIVVERSFDARTAIDEVQNAERRVAALFEERGVRTVESFLSFDGRSMMSIYDAAAVESVRQTQSAASLPFTRAWSARVERHGETSHSPAGGSVVVLERDPPAGMTEDAMREAMAASGPCFETNGVAALSTYFAADLSRIVCVFSAVDAEAVRRANRERGLPFTRAWAATHHL